jgi:hypothetical protein
MTDTIKKARPVSITITQILMAISLVPITLGLMFSLLRGLILDPLGLFSIRVLAFYGISFGLMLIFLWFGFGGLWRRRKYGYWLGLIFLGAAIAANIISFAPKMYTLLTVGSMESSYVVLGYGSNAVMIVDLVIESVILVLVIGLFLKVVFGRTEKLFFSLPT